MKLGFYIVRKTYKGQVYENEVVHVNFPKEIHEILRCLSNCNVEIKATQEGKKIHLIFSEKQSSKF